MPRTLLPAAVVCAILGIGGFWASYFGPLILGTAPPVIGFMRRDPSWVVHLHAAVMVSWLALFMAQIGLAASGRIRLHMRLGRWVMGYAAVMVAAGLLATSEGFAVRLAAGDVFRAQRWLFGPLRDVIFIVAFLAAGWHYRRRPEIHKRLMLVAATIVALPAIGRMTFLGVPVPLWKFMLVWPLPVYLAMVHDFRDRRLVHPVYVIGLAAMLTMRLVLPLNTSPAWHAVAAHVTKHYRSSDAP